MGAFEVYFKHKTIFSKLKTSMWPSPDGLATKLASIIDNLENKKPILDGVDHKDMSDSEPEVEQTELPNPKSSFVIPKVARRKQKKPKAKRKPKPPKGDNIFITNPVAYNEVRWYFSYKYQFRARKMNLMIANRALRVMVG